MKMLICHCNIQYPERPFWGRKNFNGNSMMHSHSLDSLLFKIPQHTRNVSGDGVGPGPCTVRSKFEQGWGPIQWGKVEQVWTCSGVARASALYIDPLVDRQTRPKTLPVHHAEGYNSLLALNGNSVVQSSARTV